MRSVIALLGFATFAVIMTGCPDAGPASVQDAVQSDLGADAVSADVLGSDEGLPPDVAADVADVADAVDAVDAVDVPPTETDLGQDDAQGFDVSLEVLDAGPDLDAADVDVDAAGEVVADVGNDVDAEDDTDTAQDVDAGDDTDTAQDVDAGDDADAAQDVDAGDDADTAQDVDAGDDADTAEDADSFDDGDAIADADMDVMPDQEGDAADGETDTVDADTDQGPSCPGLEPLPLPFISLPGFTTGEDFAISAEGDYYANAGGNLVRRIGGEGPLELVVPSIGNTAGMGFLPGGDLVVADVGAGALVRITPAGSKTTILSGLSYPNGLDVHWDGRVFVAEQSGGQVRAVDPDTGAFDIVAEGICSPNGVSFGPGYQRVYVGSFGCGYVYAIDEADGGGWGEPQVIGADGVAAPGASNVPGIGTGGLDGLNADTCGNIYVTDFGPGTVYRIPADLGPPEVAFVLPSFWIPNLHWGNGVGMWDQKSLYVAERSDGVLYQVKTGVLGKETTAP